MDTHSKDERVSRGVYLVTMCLAAFSCGAYTTHAAGRGDRNASTSPRLDTASYQDGGAGLPTFLLLPASPTDLKVCDGLSCPFPGPERGEEQHQCVTYLPDQGGSVTMDKSKLDDSSCNATCTVLAQVFGERTIVIEGERLDRLDREIRRGHIGRVEACTMEPTDADGSLEGGGYAVSHVKVLPFNFDKNGAFIADEDR